MRPAMCAASQLSGRGPTGVDVADYDMIMIYMTVCQCPFYGMLGLTGLSRQQMSVIFLIFRTTELDICCKHLLLRSNAKDMSILIFWQKSGQYFSSNKV